MEKLQPAVSNRLPKHCNDYKSYRDKNRYKAMNSPQRKVWDREQSLSYAQQVRLEDKRTSDMPPFDVDVSQPFAFSSTGLSPANMRQTAESAERRERAQTKGGGKKGADDGKEKLRAERAAAAETAAATTTTTTTTAKPTPAHNNRRYEEENGDDEEEGYYEDRSPSEEGGENAKGWRVAQGKAAWSDRERPIAGSREAAAPRAAAKRGGHHREVPHRTRQGRDEEQYHLDSEAMLRSVDLIMNGRRREAKSKEQHMKHSASAANLKTTAKSRSLPHHRGNNTRLQETFFFL